MAKKADPSQDGIPLPADAAPAADEPTADEDADVAAMSYEQARDELVDIVARLENGQVGLEDSMVLWARGEALAAHCARWLDSAEARITTEG
jgi:exodeoxyribonuclease VII small subunit